MSRLRICPICQQANLPEFARCLRCFAALSLSDQPAPTSGETQRIATGVTRKLSSEAYTDETSKIYRTPDGKSLLLFSQSRLEYASATVGFTTIWDNVASIAHNFFSYNLWLYHEPEIWRYPGYPRNEVAMAARRQVPLSQFDYPHNQELILDLCSYAPHLRRFVPKDRRP
jgi:hypothetical protein